MAINTTTLTQRIAHSVAQSLLSWQWTKRLLYWLVMSAGTMSECAFLIASIWMSLNASVHPLVLLFMSEQTSVHVSELATAAYVALPECILALAVVTVITHARVWFYNKKDTASLIWTVLYAIPTAIFLLLSLITLACAVASSDFRLPEYLIIIRALAGYMFAFVSLLYVYLGAPQERERLEEKDEMLQSLRQEKDGMIAALRSELERLIADNARNVADIQRENEGMLANAHLEKAQLQAAIDNQIVEIEKAKALLLETKSENVQLTTALHKSDDAALQVYSDECMSWLRSGVKTVLVEEITRYTGHSKRKIEVALNKGYLQTASRNKDLILVSSLIAWLKSVQPSTGKAEELPMLHIVNE